jgi:hypothetical protein
MTKQLTRPTSPELARFCIKTILFQDIIIYHFKVYMTSASAIVILLFLAGRLGSGQAFSILVFGGLSIFCLMCFLIQARKRSLMGIKDPYLREIAHKAMIAYLAGKRLTKKEKRFLSRPRKAVL